VSRIYFHTPDETAEVKGSERAYMRMLAADVALAVLKPDYLSRDWLMSVPTISTKKSTGSNVGRPGSDWAKVT
jgi:hypothetical protein